MKKKIAKIILLIALTFLYAYIICIQKIPDNITIFQGEQINIKTLIGIRAKIQDENNVVETISNNQEKIQDSPGTKTIKLSILDNIFLKNVNVDVLEKQTIIPVGNIAGIKLYTNGVLVVGMSEIQGIDNNKYKPYENCGIKEGDTIIEVNNNKIQNTEDLVKKINQSNGNEVKIKYLHNNNTLECSIKPVEIAKNEYKLGLWVRDSSAGVGTVTFYDPKTGNFGALGHGLTDIDTEQLIDISSGEFVNTKILNIVKGKSGEPGKIQGTIDNQENIGQIYKNTRFGIFGKVNNINSLNIDKSKEMPVALRNEIKEGKATILCSLENNKVDEYEIEIYKIFRENNYDNKSMLIRVTDERLLEKTGGIIQRNEWISNYTKWQICWSCNTCTCK